jgi:hypothetical protein
MRRPWPAPRFILSIPDLPLDFEEANGLPASDDPGRPDPPGFFIGRFSRADKQGAGTMTRTTLTIARIELRAAPRADRAWQFAS